MNSKPFDIVIIGSGLGGLLTAALLSKEGFKVLVLEKNKQIGGALQSFGLDGKLFESAVHYIGSMAKGQTLEQLFSYLGISGQLKLSRLDMNCFDNIMLNDKEYALAQGYDQFMEELSKQFPTQRNGLRNLCADIQYVCNHFPLYNLNIGSEDEKKKVMYAALAEKINKHITDPLLRQVLCGNNLLFAGDYKTSPFFLYALIQNSYIESSWTFSEGSAQLAKALQQLIIECGGDVKRNQEVSRIHEEGGLVKYVETVEGERYLTKHLISNLHPSQTYALLNSKKIRAITKQRIANTPNTLSAFMVNISLKENQIPYQNYNTYFHKEEDVWKDVQFPTQAIPNSYGIYWYPNKSNPAFATALSILCYMDMAKLPYGLASFRTTSNITSRGQDYEAWKQEKIAMIVDQVSAILPNLKQNIHMVDACTPLSYRDYLNTPEGSMYGFKKDVNDLANTTYSPRTKIPNLFFTGQNINLHGVLGVSITAILTASEFTGLPYLVNKIKQSAT